MPIVIKQMCREILIVLASFLFLMTSRADSQAEPRPDPATLRPELNAFLEGRPLLSFQSAAFAASAHPIVGELTPAELRVLRDYVGDTKLNPYIEDYRARTDALQLKRQGWELIRSGVEASASAMPGGQQGTVVSAVGVSLMFKGTDMAMQAMFDKEEQSLRGVFGKQIQKYFDDTGQSPDFLRASDSRVQIAPC